MIFCYSYLFKQKTRDKLSPIQKHMPKISIKCTQKGSMALLIHGSAESIVLFLQKKTWIWFLVPT